jgi:hypothetical protein
MWLLSMLVMHTWILASCYKKTAPGGRGEGHTVPASQASQLVSEQMWDTTLLCCIWIHLPMSIHGRDNPQSLIYLRAFLCALLG